MATKNPAFSAGFFVALFKNSGFALLLLLFKFKKAGVLIFYFYLFTF